MMNNVNVILKNKLFYSIKKVIAKKIRWSNLQKKKNNYVYEILKEMISLELFFIF